MRGDVRRVKDVEHVTWVTDRVPTVLRARQTESLSLAIRVFMLDDSSVFVYPRSGTMKS
jgi:hypothetical protein